MIYVSNQTVMQTLMVKDTGNLTRMFDQLGKLRSTITGRFMDVEIQTKWIPVHVDVEGNKPADKAAKEAAVRNQLGGQGNSEENDLPENLKEPISIRRRLSEHTKTC